SPWLVRIGDGFKTLLNFSLRTNQLFGVPDLLAEAVRVGGESLSATEGIAVVTDFTGKTYTQTKPPESSSASLAERASYLRSKLLTSRTNSERPSGTRGCWLTEYLDVGGRRFGALSFVVPELRPNPETIEFLKTLTAP